MCSIMGWCGPEADPDAFMAGFAHTKTRGPDDTRLVDTGKGLLGFHRLSIMGLTSSGMQPFELNGSYVVCNGELYGFEKEREKLKEQLGYSGKIILNVGELLPNKNQKMAVLAMKKVLETQPDARLLIAGNGPEKDNLQALVEAEGLSENVEFLGYTTSLPKYVQICDVMAACSYREGLPLNIVEAMLCGKPVAASDNRGHRELISDGQNGHLVKAGDADTLAECICEILRDPLIYSQHALETARQYTDKSVRNELAEIYEL